MKIRRATREKLDHLIESGETFQKVFQLGQVGIALLDEDGYFLKVNSTWSKMVGYRARELQNSEGLFSLIHADDHEQIRGVLARLNQEGLEEISHKTRFIKKDGSTLWASVSIVSVAGQMGKPLFYYMLARDLTDEREHEKLVEYRLKGEKVVAHISRQLLLNKATDLTDILRIVGLFTGVDRAYVFRFKSGDMLMDNTSEWCAPGVEPQIARLKNIPLDTYHWWMKMLKEEKMLRIEDTNLLPKEAGPEREILLQQAIKSLLVLPVYSRDEKIIGFIGFDAVRERRTWDEPDIRMLKILAEMIGVYWDYQRQRESMETTMNSLVNILTLVSGIRDPYTAEHQEKVAEIAVAIGDRLGIAAEGINRLKIASLLHDIGKIKIPAEIITKPGRLSAMEYEMVKEHSQIGYDILKKASFDPVIAEIVLQHHERVNGQGYPRGLSGDEIMLEAKVLGVAEVVEAMMSHRPYRVALGVEEVSREISKYSGEKYDQEVAAACLDFLSETSGHGNDISALHKEILTLLRRMGANYASPVTSEELGSILLVTPSYIREQMQDLIKLGQVDVRKGRGGGYYLPHAEQKD
ncbi:MAG: HD domain-containing phosphohydrolase [Halanaerobium sp.]|nr:HD domain-containing phosphohydrolase [Halanaerobium sp.]